jgi:hypothetical protein
MMKSLPIALLAIAYACSTHTAPAQAQVPRTFVSAAGSDTNPCTFAAPCRHFQAAVNATSPGGEVDALDPAGYGPINISQAVTIEGQGWSYIAPPTGGNGITINAVSGNVIIRGVSINGVGITGTTNGIVFDSGASLTVENCVVRSMEFDGLVFLQTGVNQATLTVSNSYFSNNSDAGILIETGSSGRITAAIDRTELSGNPSGAGLHVQGSFGTGSIHVGVTDSVAANNSIGFKVESNVSHAAIKLSLTHAAASGNSVGLEVDENTTLWLAQSTLSGNAAGFAIASGGAIMSYGDNYLAADLSFTDSGTLTSVAKQ